MIRWTRDDFVFTSTFECICGSRGKVLVWVKLQCQLPVGLFQIFIASVFGNTKDFIKILAILYPVTTKHVRCYDTNLAKTLSTEHMIGDYSSISQKPPLISSGKYLKEMYCKCDMFAKRVLSSIVRMTTPPGLQSEEPKQSWWTTLNLWSEACDSVLTGAALSAFILKMDCCKQSLVNLFLWLAVVTNDSEQQQQTTRDGSTSEPLNQAEHQKWIRPPGCAVRAPVSERSKQQVCTWEHSGADLRYRSSFPHLLR